MASDDLHSDWAAWLDAELAEAETAALRGHRRELRRQVLVRALAWTSAVALAVGLGFGLVYTAKRGPAPHPSVSAGPSPAG